MSRLSARGLIFNSRDEILLVRDRRNYWYTPGGGIEQGETSVEALIREVYEETGLQLTEPVFLFAREHRRSEQDVHFSWWYLAETQQRLPQKWVDSGGPISESQFFSKGGMPTAKPDFLQRMVWEWKKEDFKNAPKLITD